MLKKIIKMVLVVFILTNMMLVMCLRARSQRVVFLVTKDSLNYLADSTVPAFAKQLSARYHLKTIVLKGRGKHIGCQFPGLDLSKADLLIIFCRRIALPDAQMNEIRKYLAKGKPLIGIRTANHAFSPMEMPLPGYVSWPQFPDSVLGCKNRGYGPVGVGIDISVASAEAHHSVIESLPANHWISSGNIYKVTPLLDSQITVLLNGKQQELQEPVAWQRMYGNSKIFYTSLGVPDDFKNDNFRELLFGAIRWALHKE